MTPGNPDLPILDELGREYRALVDSDFGAEDARPQRAAPRPSRALPRRRRGAHRVARRSAIVLILLCLIGGVALAAQLGRGDGAKEHTAPVAVAEDGSAGWQLSGYRDRGRLCILFTAAAELTSQCGSLPTADGLRFGTTIADGRRYFAGFTGPSVGAIGVRIAGHRASAPARRVAADAAAAAGLPKQMHWFVVPVDLPANALKSPARIDAFGSQGERVGSRRLDCSLGVVGPSCVRQIRARAAAALR